MPPRYSFEPAYYTWFYDFEFEHLFKQYITRGFVPERNIKLESFRDTGVQKIIEERGWESTISNVPRFMAKLVYELYANLNDNIADPGKREFERVMLEGTFTIFLLEPFAYI